MPARWFQRALGCTALLAAVAAQAQTTSPAPAQPNRAGRLDWQACYAMKDSPGEQLACFQNWAASQFPANTPPPELASVAADPAAGRPPTEVLLLPGPGTEAPDGKPVGCRDDRHSPLSKFWELQRGSDCDTFAIRGYRPISLSLVDSNRVNTQPNSGNTGNTANATQTAEPYRSTEGKIQLSVRTKIAKGLLTAGGGDEAGIDSLWFGYTAQSYWQLFTGNISRPFRNTDHEPELIYVYPHQVTLPGGWSYRLSGAGLVHQSNGQPLPLSRSWNRLYLMGAAEKIFGPESSVSLQARVWNRVRERPEQDDNPNIEDYVGRAEITSNWKINQANTLGVSFRHSLKSEARGSTRIDWLRAPKASTSYTGLRYHVQLFNGYGDSLIDFNHRRTVLSVGLSLVDW